MKYNGLYYPYTGYDADTLKKAILYFDKIFIFNPYLSPTAFADKEKLQRIRNSQSYYESYAEFSNGVDITDTLEKEGLLEYISPKDILDKYDNDISENTRKDLNNKDYLDFCHEVGHNKEWAIGIERLPRNTSFLDPIYYRNQLSKPRWFSTSFEAGESLLLNHAIAAANEKSSSLVTDNLLHHKALILKLKIKDSATKDILKDYGYIKDTKINLTAIDIINEVIPTLENADFNELLKFRHDHKLELERFRIEMGKLATDIKANYWDSDYYMAVRDKVDDRIKPVIMDLMDSSKSYKDKLINGMSKVVKLAPLPLIATVFPALPPTVALAAGGAAGGLEYYLESKKGRQPVTKNGLSYLLEIKKRF